MRSKRKLCGVCTARKPARRGCDNEASWIHFLDRVGEPRSGAAAPNCSPAAMAPYQAVEGTPRPVMNEHETGRLRRLRFQAASTLAWRVARPAPRTQCRRQQEKNATALS